MTDIQVDEEDSTGLLFGTGPYSTLNIKVEMKEHPNKIVEKGLFAKELIKKGEVVWYDPESDDLETFKIDDIHTLSKEKRDFICHFCYQIDENLFRIPKNGVENEIDDYADFTNVRIIN
jgi:hypothetical protein